MTLAKNKASVCYNINPILIPKHSTILAAEKKLTIPFEIKRACLNHQPASQVKLVYYLQNSNEEDISFL